MGLDRALLCAIERIYAAAREPGEWQPALEQAVDLLGAGHAFLHVAEPAPAGLHVVARVDERDLAQSLSAAAGPIGRVGAAMLAASPAGVPAIRSSLVSDQAFLRSAYYNEVVRPLNGFHSLTVRQTGFPAEFVVGFCRPMERGNFGAREAMLLAAMLPHLANAVGVAIRLRAAEQRSASLAGVLDRIDSAVILADASARPLFVNERAARLLEEADGLAIEAVGLIASTPAATRLLRDAIVAAAISGCDGAAPSATAGSRLCLTRQAPRLPLLATVLPAAGLDAALGVARHPGAAIFITEPDACAAVDQAAVAEAFRLTRREAEIAALLADGDDLARIATALGLALGTTRNHLKRIFAKTDTHSQAALAARLRGFAAVTR